ncbi:MAG: hypothetical protein ACU84Q_20960 [Gammaproteobacteria bacterium]
MGRYILALVVLLGQSAHADMWLCTVEQSKAVSAEGRFGESTMSPATVEPFLTFEVSIEENLYIRGGPFNLPDEMRWVVLSPGGLNSLDILGFADGSARNRYVLFSMEEYAPGDSKPFFATDGGTWLLYSGLCRQR